MTILSNLLVIFLLAAPAIVLNLLAPRIPWLEKRKEGVGVFVWIITLYLIYLLLLPRLGLEPNSRFFRE